MSIFARCGLVVKRDAPDALACLDAVLQCLRSLNIPVMLDDETRASLAPDEPSCALEAMPRHADLLIVIGGDGTLLRACRTVLRASLPVLGINLGRLGFMVDIAPGSIATVLPQIMAGEYVTDPRLVLQARIAEGDDLGLAVNDVVVRHPDPVSMLEFATYADERLISHHRADGMVISTPTGSTAYALSAGGPMLHPASPALAMVPICPHTLNDRPLILPAGKPVRVVISGRDGRGAIVTLDGHHNTALANGETLIIEQSEHALTLIHPRDYDWYGILRSKLNWGRDKPASTPG